MLDTPTNVIATSIGFNSILIRWDNVSGATNYIVQRSSDNVTFVEVASTTSTSFDNSGLACGVTYYYRVQAFDGSGNYSSFSDVHAAIAVPAAPTLSSLPGTETETSVQLRWGKITGASGYRLYRAIYGGAFTQIAIITNGATTLYTDTGLTTGIAYCYRMVAYYTNTITGANVDSGFSNELTYTPKPQQPQNLSVTSSSYNTLKISWSAVANATSYTVERTDKENGAFTALTTVTTNSYVDSYLQTGLTYYYRVYATVGGAIGEYSVVKSGVPVPVTPSGLVANSRTDTTIRVSWTASSLSGYSGYSIQMKGPGDADYAEIKDIQSATITNTVIDSLVTGQLYYFRVLGYTNIRGGRVFSLPSAQVSCRPKPSTPASFKIAITDYNELSPTWGAVNGAYAYDVYFSASAATSSFVKVATIRDTGASTYSYAKSGLTTGTLYYFRVIAYVMDGSLPVYGEYTAILGARPRPVSVQNLTLISATYNGANVRWDAVNGATGYELLTCATAAGTYTVNKSVAGITGSVTGQTTGKLLYIKVRAYRTVNGTRYYGPVSSYISMRPTPAKPVLSGASVSLTQVSLKWNAILGASGYEIYSCLDKTGTYTLTKSVTGSTTTAIINVNAGAPLWYKVRAYTTYGDTTVYGAFSAVVLVQAIPSAPVISSVCSVNETSLKVSWNRPTDIAGRSGGYYVRRSNTNSWADLKTISTLTRTDFVEHVDTSLSLGQIYFYVVRAYVDTDYGVVAGKSSVMVGGYTLPTVPTGLTVRQNAFNRLTLEWMNSSNVTGFEVYYATASNGTYSKLATCPDNTIGLIRYDTPAVLEYNKQYYIKVRAYLKTGATIVYSPFTASIPARTSLAAPDPITVVPAGSNAIKVTWTKVGTSYGYRVYVSENATSGFQLCATVPYTTNTATVSGLTLGKTYYVRVAAYRSIGSDIRDGFLSAVKSTRVAPSVPGNLTATVLGYRSVKLQWNTVTGVTGYKVYRRVGTTGTWSIVKDNLTATSITLDNQTTGTDYNYYVCCFVKASDGTQLRSAASNIVAARPILLKPTSVVARFLSPASVVISWSRVANASGYMVLRSTTANGTYSTIATLQSGETFSYTDDVASIAGIGSKLYYRVKAYSLDPNATSLRYPGYSSATVNCTVLPPTPTGMTASRRDVKTISLTWMSASSVNGYEIWRSTGNSSNFKLIKTITTPASACRDFNLAQNVRYYYRIRSYHVVGGVKVYSGWSSIANCILSTSTASNFTVTRKDATTAQLRWTFDSTATGYEIWRSKGNTTSWARLKNVTTGGACGDFGMAKNTTYYYKVCPYYIADDGRIIFGGWSTVKNITLK